jgi:hypothetical protein
VSTKSLNLWWCLDSSGRHRPAQGRHKVCLYIIYDLFMANQYNIPPAYAELVLGNYLSGQEDALR